MKVLVDTCVWSLALRGRQGALAPDQRRLTREWEELVREGRIAMIGPIRQELLSGIRGVEDFEKTRRCLAAFDDVPLGTADYEHAARLCDVCRSRGVSGSPTGFLICSVALRLGATIFTTDADFRRYATHLPLRLHGGRREKE